MTHSWLSIRRWIERAALATTLSMALGGVAASAGCGSKSGSTSSAAGTGGKASSSTTASSAATGGMGGAASSTVASSSASTGGAGGAGTGGSMSTGGAGGDAGTDGSDGGWMPPMGTAEYPAEVEPNNTDAQANPLAAGTKGFTASIWPLGDVDEFSFDVTVNGSAVTVATSDGKGGCPAGAHTYVRISDANENVIAQDPGTMGCVSLTPANTAALAGVAIGTYYVHVESTYTTLLPFYIVDIQVTAPVCGDGIVQVANGEQCDHGATNGMPGDGCSATCQILGGSYVNETEPNDTAAKANSLDSYAGAVGQINPIGDVDFYSLDVTVANSSIFAQISDGFGKCPNAFDSTLSLYSPTMTLLVADQGGGVAPCSKISPIVHPAAANLPVGTYYLEVARKTSQLQTYYVLDAKVTPPSCGDGILEPGEQCDPGPVMVQGCSATCQLTGDFIPETEPNDTVGAANPLGTHQGFLASIKPVGDQDFFSFSVPGPSSLVFLQVGDGIGGCPVGFDSQLTLYGPSMSQIAFDDNGGPSLCSRISPLLYPAAKNLAGGTYYAKVNYAGNNTLQSEYVLTISVRQPGCGDGYREGGEQCDDGPLNGTSGDGCSATCQSIAPWEVEPNDTFAMATPLWNGFSTWKASISPIGDHDFFAFTLSAAGMVTLTTHDVDNPTYCSSDTFITLYDGGGTPIVSNDDGGPGPGEPGGGKCSQINMLPVAAGNYLLFVQHYMDKGIIPAYQLDLLVQ